MPTLGSATPNEAPLRVLIIDDHPLASRMIEIYFMKLKIEVEIDSASDGSEGLVYLGDNTYDILFCDILMPHVNGLQVLGEFRNTESSTWVVMMTATHSKDLVSQALSMGCNDFLVKPFTLPTFKEHLGRYFAAREDLDREAAGDWSKTVP